MQVNGLLERLKCWQERIKKQEGDIVTEWFSMLKAKKEGQRALTEWTREKWDYVSPKSKKKGRYAPKAVADAMSSSEKAYENRKKREGTKKGKQHVPRGKSSKKKYKRVEGL